MLVNPFVYRCVYAYECECVYLCVYMCVYEGWCTPLCHELLVNLWVHLGVVGVAVRVQP